MNASELTAQVELLKLQIKTIDDQLADLRSLLAETTKELKELRIEFAGFKQRQPEADKIAQQAENLAVLSSQVEELRKTGDEWGKRIWGLVQVLIGAAIGGVLTYLLKH